MRTAHDFVLAGVGCLRLPLAARADGAIADDDQSGAYGSAHNYCTLR